METLSAIKKRGGRRIFSYLYLILVVLSLTCSPGYTEEILSRDDFESGNADNWQLDDGWQVVKENENFVLKGTNHAAARFLQKPVSTYNVQIKVNLKTNESSTHINYRADCERYFIGFNSTDIYLNKTYPCGSHFSLKSISEPHDINRWYKIKIIGDQGNIKVYVDDILKIDYTDSEPILTGGINLENLNGTVYYDDLVITTDELISGIQFVYTGGPLGGLGYDVRIHPDNNKTLFVSDNFAGVAKSEDAGKTWYPSNSGISIKSGATGDAVNIFCLTIDPGNPDIIWTGTFGEGTAFGIFKSVDGGTTWQLKNNGISMGDAAGLVFRGFTVQQNNSNVVYAQVEVRTPIDGWEFNRTKGRVYKTLDGGDNWQIIWEGDNLARYLIIAPDDPDSLYLSTGIFDREAYNSDCQNSVAGGVGVLKSMDGGATWSAVNNGLTDLYVGSLRMHPANPNILFAATGNNACSGLYTGNITGGLFRTTSKGLSWSKVINKEIMTTVNFSPSDPDTIYAGSTNAFYQSKDNGDTWAKFSKPGREWGPKGVTAGVPIDMVVDPDDPDLLYANNYGGGVFRSLDGAQTWEEWSKGYTGAEIHDVCVVPGLSPTVYAIGRSGPFASSNYGEKWTGIANDDAKNAEWYSITHKPGNPNVVLIADEHEGEIFYSTNGGENFVKILKHPNANSANPDMRQGFKSIAYSFSNPNIVYAGLSKNRPLFRESSPAGTVIYKSVDAGRTFSPLTSIIDSHNVRQLRVDPDNPEIIYAATTNGLYTSNDGALNWHHLESLGARQIEVIAIDSDQKNYIIAGELYGGIWISQDGGSSWTGPHNQGFNSSNPYISALAMDPKNRSIIFAGDLYSGIYQSLDKGLTWAPFPDFKMSGLNYRAVTDIEINETILYAATQGGGVFRYWKGTGDINKTGFIDMTDAVQILQILIGLSPEETSSDGGAIKGNSTPYNLKDVIYILQRGGLLNSENMASSYPELKNAAGTDDPKGAANHETISKIALLALEDEKTIEKLSARFNVHPIMLYNWKRSMFENQ